MLSQRSKKHHHAGAPNIVPDPLVNPGNPSHRHQARSAAHLDRPCSRMVALAACSPGRRSPRSPQTKNATVMLSRSCDAAFAPGATICIKLIVSFRANLRNRRWNCCRATWCLLGACILWDPASRAGGSYVPQAVASSSIHRRRCFIEQHATSACFGSS